MYGYYESMHLMILHERKKSTNNFETPASIHTRTFNIYRIGLVTLISASQIIAEVDGSLVLPLVRARSTVSRPTTPTCTSRVCIHKVK